MKKKNALKQFKMIAILFLVLFHTMVSEKTVVHAESDTTNANAELRLENCKINPKEIFPGDTITVTANLKNTSQIIKIKNMKIKYENSENILTPTDNSGVIYIEEIAVNQVASISFQMKVGPNVTNFNQKISLEIQYEDETGKQYNATEIIYITILPTPDAVSGSISNLFEIDNSHTFTGMDSSYKSGYVPNIKEGKVRVVMPLKFKGNSKVYGDEITASIEFATIDNKPIHIKNYTKKVKLKSNKTKGEEKLDLYLVDFSMDLDKERVNGVYPVNIKIQYELDLEVKEQIFTVYVVIKDGIDPNAVEEPEDVKPATRISVSSCTLVPSNCHTGEQVTFQVSLKNMSTDIDVRNIKLTYASNTGDLRPSEENNSIYIESIKAGKTKTISFKMDIAGEVSTPNQSISLNLEGEDINGLPISAAESLYLVVELPFGMKVESPVLANTMKSGTTKTIKFPVMNTGKTKIRNIICELDMEGVISKGSFFIGELESGVSAEVSLGAIIANKMTTDTSVLEKDKYGYVSGTIKVSYEDTQGKAYNEVLEVSTKITPKTPTADKGEISSQWWISTIIGLISIQLIVFIAMFYRKKRSIIE